MQRCDLRHDEAARVCLERRDERKGRDEQQEKGSVPGRLARGISHEATNVRRPPPDHVAFKALWSGGWCVAMVRSSSMVWFVAPCRRSIRDFRWARKEGRRGKGV